MKTKFIVTIGYTKLAFENKEAAMGFYSLLTEATPCTSVYVPVRPAHLEGINYVRNSEQDISLNRVDASQFALQWDEAEFKEKCKPKVVDIEGDVSVVEDAPLWIGNAAPEDELEPL